jgi:methyl-accepting chemotaxis protein
MSREEIGRRTAFMNLGQRSAGYAASEALLRQTLPGALEAFYDRIRATPETRAFFRDEAHIGAAKTAQVSHWDAIIEGRADAAYGDAVRRIGNVHARIGLEPRWYMGGYSVVLARLLEAITTRPRKLFDKQHDRQTAEAAGELSRRVLLDMDLAISTYLEALQVERAKVEAAKAEAEARQAQVVSILSAALKTLAAGDLASTITAPVADEYVGLKDDFNAAVMALREAFAAVTESAAAVSSGSLQLARASDDLAMRTERQAATVERTSHNAEQIADSVEQTAVAAKQSVEAVGTARRDVEHGIEVVAEATQAMAAISESSGNVGGFVTLIDEIAFQTNLLALNAGVEAARAGEFGRGFAVVASEVRALAQRSAAAAREIRTVMQQSSDEVSRGVELVTRTGDALGRIGERVADVDSLAGGMATSAREQADRLADIKRAILQIDEITQQNAAMTEEATAASRQLAAEAEALMLKVQQFEIGADDGPASHRYAA